MSQLALSSLATFSVEECVSQITIDVCARVWSKVCRFAGHTRHFYSVAQHSANVAAVAKYMAERRGYIGVVAGRLGLYHEIDEIAVGDVISPVKEMMKRNGVMELRDLSKRLLTEWVSRQPDWFSRPVQTVPEYYNIMSAADRIVLYIEARCLIDQVHAWASDDSYYEYLHLCDVPPEVVESMVDLHHIPEDIARSCFYVQDKLYTLR